MSIDRKFWNNKKVIITGHTGFKGAWLSLVLKKLNSELYGFSLDPIKNSVFDLCDLKSIFCESYYLDLTDDLNFKKFNKKLEEIQPDIVIHLAAQSLVIESFKDPRNTLITNVNLGFNVLEATNNVESIKNLLITTTDKVYKYPAEKNTEDFQLGGNDFYSSTKSSMELITNSFVKSFKRSDLNIATARAGNVVGGGDKNKYRLIPDILNSVEKNQDIILRNPSSIRPWQHVLDPITGYLKLIQYLDKNNISDSWNFSPDSNNEKTVLEVTELVTKNFPDYKKNILVKDSAFKESEILRINSKKAFEDFGWKCNIKIEESIGLITEWEQGKNNDILNLTISQIERYI